MTASAERTFLRTFWEQLGGAPQHIEQVTFAGPVRALPSVYEVSALASACVAAASLAVSELHALRHGKQLAAIELQRAHAAAAFRSERLLQGVGWQLPAIWDPIAGDYATRDGFVRLHTNYLHHRRAVERVLGQTERASIAEVAQAYAAEELESLVVDAGGCAAAMRSAQSFRDHPQGRAVAALPLISWHARASGPGAWQRNERPGAPFAGVRVLDLTRVLAGPICTRFLAAYGADVLRIDPPEFSEVEAALGDTTWGKRRARLDLRETADRARFEQLLAQAHVLVHGYRGDALARLGFSSERLASLAPGLIEVSLNAYGSEGPWANRRGFDSLVQMSCGIAARGMERYEQARPHPLPAQALDHGTGYLMVASVARALSRQWHEGVASRCRLSLAGTAHCLMQLGEADEIAGPELELAAFLPHCEEVDSQLGRLRRVRCPGQIEGVAQEPVLPAGPLGSDPPVWR
ncbi:MAG: CoA transferase [Myxococcales bacterium]